MGCVMPFLNIIRLAVIKLRQERGWSQEVLAARLQCQGADFSRDVLANIESGRTHVTDNHIKAFQKAFGVPVVRLFPKSVQDLDETFARREADRAGRLARNRRHKPRR
jgi:transcriptional regulator with XRE-family HTH domain